MQNRFTPAHINADETLNWFKAYWDGDSYPSPATGCGNCRQATHVSGVEACVCDATVIDEAVFSGDPSSVVRRTSSSNIRDVPDGAEEGSGMSECNFLARASKEMRARPLSASPARSQ